MNLRERINANSIGSPGNFASRVRGAYQPSTLSQSSYNTPQVKDPMETVQRQTDNLRTRIQAAGQGDKLDTPSKFSVTKLLQAVAAPGYAANNMIKEFIAPDSGSTPGEFDPLKAYWRGLKGDEKPSGGDLAREIGIENKVLANSLGFVFDIFNPLDVVNWVTFGVGKAVTMGGIKGSKALATAFGDDAAEAIVKILGNKVDDVAAKSVGELSKNVMKIAKDTGLASSDDLAKLMTEGVLKTHNSLSTKLPFSSYQKLTMGLETPLGFGRKQIGTPVELPGSQYITKPIKAGAEAFTNTKAGDKLGKMFSTKFTPKEVPDSMILKTLQERGAKVGAEVAERGAQKTTMGVAPEIIDNTMEIAPEVNKAVKRAVEYTEVEGAKVYGEFREGITKVFETVPRKEEEFFKQVNAIFAGTSPKERQQVLDAVLYPTDRFNAGELPENIQLMADNFVKWREGLVKTYKQLEIPVNELENYVPFIPVRSLKKSEREGLNAIYGTVEKAGAMGDDGILDMVKRLDPNLKQRTTNAIDPREVNKLLTQQGGKPWLSEDPAHMMMVRGTRGIKTEEAAGFIQDFTKQYGLTPEDLVKLKGTPKGYGYFENVTDGTGSQILKKVGTLTDANSKNVVAIPEEFAEIFNDYMEVFYNKDSKNAVLNLFDKATMVWKKWAYLYNPGHIPRDTTGNIWQGYLMGMRDPKYYAHSMEATKTVPKMMETLTPLLKELGEDVDITDIDVVLKTYKSAVKSGKITPSIIELNGKKIDVFEAWQKARSYGAMETIAAMADTPRTIRQALNIAEGQKLATGMGKYEDAMRKWTEGSNNWARFSGYLHQLGQGKSHTAAAAQVKKFYFDYFDLTPFERKVMKRAMPFYTWTRKNIPMELEALMKRPKDFAWVQKGIDAIEGENRDEDVPDWARKTGLVKLGDTGKYFNPNMPYQDLGRLPVNQENIANLLASFNPLIRGPIEMSTNTELYSGKPIERYKGEEQNLPIVGALMNILDLPAEQIPKVNKKGLGYLVNQLPMLRNLDTALDPKNPRQTARLGSMVGIPSSFDAEQLKRSKIYEDNNELNELIRLLKARGIEIPTLDEINSDPRDKLLKQLGLK